MGQGQIVYGFEGIAEDLPRPPMAALRALLSAGVLVSARGWQELSIEARQGLARAGVGDPLDQQLVANLLKQVPVSQLKLIGKKSDPSASSVPPELLAALGPVRPLTVGEWQALRAVDRFVLDALVKNTRLLGRAMNEMVPQRGSMLPGGGGASAGAAASWSGTVARAELRLRRDVVKKVVTADFMNGRAFVLANVAGRRAARRASELLDAHAEATVGPVEIDWGYRVPDDVLFWQAHVSAWDGTFFPAAALLAATSAAVAMYDMVKVLDADATLTLAGIREEPWQAGRHEVQEESTALYKVGAKVAQAATQKSLSDTVHTGAPNMEGSNTPADLASIPIQKKTVPLAPSSTPALQPAAPDAAPRPASALGSGPYAAPAGAALGSGPYAAPLTSSSPVGFPSSTPTVPRSARGRPAWVTVTVVALIVVANVLITAAIVLYLTRRHHH